MEQFSNCLVETSRLQLSAAILKAAFDVFTEQDWKLFRQRLPGWQEAYMDRLNLEYIELLQSGEKPSEMF